MAAVEHALPSKQISNDWVIDRLRRDNASRLSTDQLAATESVLRRYFEAAGTETRYYLDDGEKAIDIVAEAGRRALSEAAMAPNDIEFVIYTGVSRGWVEPATAPAVQEVLGLHNASAFDILEACAGWLRALEVAQGYISTGAYRRGMIVNCECGLGEQADWELGAAEDLEHRAAAYTIGEAATATIVDAGDGTDDFVFKFKSVGRHFDLCTIPLKAFRQFHPGDPDDRYVEGRLFTLSRDLVGVVTTLIKEVFDSDPRFHREFDICLCHEVSEKVCRSTVRKLGLEQAYFTSHRRFGNTVAASIPLGMSTAYKEGALQRGDEVLAIVGASGVSVGMASFTF